MSITVFSSGKVFGNVHETSGESIYHQITRGVLLKLLIKQKQAKSTATLFILQVHATSSCSGMVWKTLVRLKARYITFQLNILYNTLLGILLALTMSKEKKKWITMCIAHQELTWIAWRYSVKNGNNLMWDLKVSETTVGLALGWSWNQIRVTASCKHRLWPLQFLRSFPGQGFHICLIPPPQCKPERSALLPERGHALSWYLYGWRLSLFSSDVKEQDCNCMLNFIVSFGWMFLSAGMEVYDEFLDAKWITVNT